MSREVRPPAAAMRRRVCLVILTLCLLALPGAPVAAQELPECAGPVRTDCVLPSWPEGVLDEAPSLFGDVAGQVWVEDAAGDAPPGGLDLLAVGVGTVSVDAPGDIRRSGSLLTRGKAARAVRRGDGIVVRIVLDRPADAIEEGYSGVHLVTDIDGSRSNNAPAGVSEVNGPWAGWQDVYSLTYATTSDSTLLLDTDLTGKWYRDKDAFAAAWAAPGVLDLLLQPSGIGEGFAVVTFVGGSETGGYDTLTLDARPIPVDGRVGLRPSCIGSSIVTEPFTVRRIVENGQTLRDVEVRASWQAGASIPVDGDARAALESLVAANDADDDGRIGLPSTVSLVEEGLIMRQRPEVALALVGDDVQLAVQLGLTRRGYAVLRDIVLQPTGDEIADRFLQRAALAIVEATPAFRVGRNPGLLDGHAMGSCVPALMEAPEPMPTATAEPAESATPVEADDPAEADDDEPSPADETGPDASGPDEGSPPDDEAAAST